MAKMFIKPKTEIIAESLRRVFRKNSHFNKMENETLTVDYVDALRKVRETNSKIVWDMYYIPKAISAILKEENYLVTAEQAAPRAKAMLLADLANGVIDDFYRFK